MKRVVLACSLVTSACISNHVKLEAPGKDAPEADRIAAYERIRPVGRETVIDTTYTRDRRTGQTSRSSTSYERLMLADGRSVADAGDFLPVVERDSETARQIVVLREAESSGDTKRGIGWGIAGAGAATALAGQAAGEDTLLWVGVGVSMVGLLCTWILPMSDNERASAATAAAFKSYDRDLVSYLALDGLVRHDTPVIVDARGDAPPTTVRRPDGVIRDARAKRDVLVSIDGVAVMELGDRPGALTSASADVAPSQHPFATVTVLSALHEPTLRDIVAASASFDDLVARLRAAGFDVR